MSEKYQEPLTSLSHLSNLQGNDTQLIHAGEEIPLTLIFSPERLRSISLTYSS